MVATLRFRLAALFWAVGVFAILFAFARSERIGDPICFVESISFSTDGAEIGVAVLGARSSAGGTRLSDFSRGLCIVKALTGELTSVLQQGSRESYRGHFFEIWHVGRTSAVIHPAGGAMLALDFGGGRASLYRFRSGSAESLSQYDCSGYVVAVSKSGRRLAIAGLDVVTILEVASGQKIAELTPTVWHGFLLAPFVTFSDDEESVIVAGEHEIQVWEIASAAQLATVHRNKTTSINSIAIGPDNTVIVCSDQGVFLYSCVDDATPTILNRAHGGTCCAASSERMVAYGYGKQLHLHDLESGNTTSVDVDNELTSLCFSPSGNVLAFGDDDGRLSLLDSASGQVLWSIHPPVRHGTPWTIPAFALVLWTFVPLRLFVRSRWVGTNNGDGVVTRADGAGDVTEAKD